MRVTVIGGSAAGLLMALTLARAGHRVVVVERDPLVPAADVEVAAATAFRPAAPQLVQPHVVLGRCRDMLRARLPDVYAALLAAGVVEVPLQSQMPPTLTDRSCWPGDERMPLLMTRRSTVDWVLRRIVATEPGIDVRDRTQVLGLLADPGAAPRVVGVRTDRGDLVADIVMDAAGRRSPVDRWLAGIGARPSAVTRAQCGVSYVSRQYRLLGRGAAPGPPTVRLTLPLAEFFVGIWGGDNDTVQIAIAPLAQDRRFRGARDPEVFDAVLRTVPIISAWLDVVEPMTPIAVMGGLHNTLRRLVVEERPVVLGLHCVGDAVCTTNPTFGRGLSMTACTVAQLLDTVTAHPDDPHAQAMDMDHAVRAQLAPWFADQAAVDGGRLAQLRHTVLGAPPPPPPVPATDRITFAQLGRFAPADPMAFRAFWRLMGMVGLPDDIYRDPALVVHIRQLAATGTAAPPLPSPPRAELATALRTPAGVTT